MEVLKDLNEPQKEAVSYGDGPLLILAGAGSGKTRVLTRRIAYLIDQRGIPPYNILGVTFTNKAAEEMEERIESLVPQSTESLWMGTFHALSVRVLRREIEELGYGKNFVIYDAGESLTLIKNTMASLNIDPKEIRPHAIRDEISRLKSELKAPHQMGETGTDFFKDTVYRVYFEYQKTLKQSNALDFDDLIMVCVRLWTENPEILEKYRKRFRYILVDEYQDVNYAQYRWINLLAGKNGNLTVVGDPDQGIYGFRGADIRNILSFESDYPRAKIIKLEENYRSSQNILSGAQGVISVNSGRKEKDLWTRKGEGDPIRIKEFFDGDEEAFFVAQEIRSLLDQGKKPTDIAVFYRTNAQSRALETAFRNTGLYYRIIGGTGFYDRMEIKDIMAYLKVIFNPHDILSLLRIINTPRRGIGKGTLNVLKEEAEQTGVTMYEALGRSSQLKLPSARQKKLTEFYSLLQGLREEAQSLRVDHLAEEILRRTGYRKQLEDEGTVEAQTRLENIEELFNVMGEVDETGIDGLEEFLREVALYTDLDYYQEEQEEGIPMMTLHTAKGLEFPVVFIVGTEEGFCPHTRCQLPDEIEEERRLFYVGMTRAQKLLYITYARQRKIYGTDFRRIPSPFLEDIPEEVLEKSPEQKEEKPDIEEVEEKNNANDPPPEYKAGQKVRHPSLGVGKIVAVKGSGSDTQLTLAFDGQGIKEILVEYVDLEIIKD